MNVYVSRGRKSRTEPINPYLFTNQMGSTYQTSTTYATKWIANYTLAGMPLLADADNEDSSDDDPSGLSIGTQRVVIKPKQPRIKDEVKSVKISKVIKDINIQGNKKQR